MSKRIGLKLKTLAVAGLAAIGAMGLASTANAAIYNFSYTASTGVLSGQIDGALQADHNTLLINAILAPEFNGAAGAPLTFLSTLSTYVGGPVTTPKVTLDGSAMEFLACTASPICMDGFLIDTTGFYGGSAVSSGMSYGALFETYAAANWTISAVPEPASWALMLTGVAGLGLVLRRRKSLAAAAI